MALFMHVSFVHTKWSKSKPSENKGTCQHEGQLLVIKFTKLVYEHNLSRDEMGRANIKLLFFLHTQQQTMDFQNTSKSDHVHRKTQTK